MLRSFLKDDRAWVHQQTLDQSLIAWPQ
jgi:hypothetical protein